MTPPTTAAATRNVVALLRCVIDHDDEAADTIIRVMPRWELQASCACAVLMLAHETVLACADAMVPVDDYLQAMGLACAELAEEDA